MTIKDIAKLAGVSVSTVSRVLNGHPDIKSETKEKIHRIIAENNFIPNSNAKNLKQTAGKSILLLIKGNSNMFFSVISEQIQKRIDKTGFAVSVHYLDEQADEAVAAVRLSREQKPVGIIFLGGNLKNLQNSFGEITVPCVLSTANAKELPFANLSSVSINDFEAGKKAADFLFDMGHEKIGIISGDIETSNPSQLRYAGIKESFMRHGKNVNEIIHEKSSYTLNSAYEAATALVQRNSDITAIFAMSDIMAMGTIRALTDMGKHVPEDVSVLGFDGIELSDYCCPRIATIAQPSQQIADLSVRLIIDMIEHNALASHVQLKVSYKSGESICHI